MLGPDRRETREVTYLGRTIRWGQDGVRWSANLKHVEAFRAPGGYSRPIERGWI